MSVKKYLDKLNNLKGKKVIITGGTSGIGLSIVDHLLYKEADVVIMARNIQKANDVKCRFIEKYPNSNISIVQYDQSDSQSIISTCQEIVNNHSDFYALIMNAGIFQPKGKTTYVNDIAQTINTNFVGLNTLLTNLLPNLKGKHRFIFQGSFVAGYRIKRIKSLKDKNISAWQHYLISKAGVESIFYHHSQIEYDGFSFYLVEPGLTNSEIIRDFPTPIKQMGHVFMKVVSHSTDKAALTAMLALEESTIKNSFIVPRGLGTFMGYPRIKSFPRKREKPNLYDLLNQI